MIDFMDFQAELIQTTRENIKLSNDYLTARKSYASNFNKLIVLVNKAGLSKSKKAIENKIAELLACDIYGIEANEIYKQMLEDEAVYKGLEVVCKAYQTHSSGLQSIIKQQINGEIAEATKNKYSNSP